MYLFSADAEFGQLVRQLKGGVNHEEGVQVVNSLETLNGKLNFAFAQREIANHFDLLSRLGRNCDFMG